MQPAQVMNKFQAVPNPSLLRQIQGEYLEMPGLKLTLGQAQRLLGLEAACCETLLNGLVEMRFLARGPDGQFLRVLEGSENGPMSRHMVRGTLRGERPTGRRKETA